MVMIKDDYIRLISKASDRYGNHLIELMDEYGCRNLQEITLEQAKHFYECLMERKNEMTINEYQIEALRTASGMNTDSPMIVNGVLGLCGESGECADIVKKHLFQGHALDAEHLAKELGDVAWYLAVSAYSIGFDLETIMQMNVDKLRNRYPDGFDPEKSQHRQEGDV